MLEVHLRLCTTVSLLNKITVGHDDKMAKEVIENRGTRAYVCVFACVELRKASDMSDGWWDLKTNKVKADENCLRGHIMRVTVISLKLDFIFLRSTTMTHDQVESQKLPCGGYQTFTAWPHKYVQTVRQISVRSRGDSCIFRGRSWRQESNRRTPPHA